MVHMEIDLRWGNTHLPLWRELTIIQQRVTHQCVVEDLNMLIISVSI